MDKEEYEEELDEITAIKELAIKMASNLWCFESTSHIVMIPEIACVARDEFMKLLSDKYNLQTEIKGLRAVLTEISKDGADYTLTDLQNMADEALYGT